jgi:hypothetical protein
MVDELFGWLTCVFLKNVPFHITIVHPKPLRGLWGVTLPSIYESGPGAKAGMITEIEWRDSGRHQRGLCPPTQE